LYVPVVDVGWSEDVGRLLRGGKGAAIGWVVQPDMGWHACHKSVDTLGYGPLIAALEQAACGGGRVGCIVVRTVLVVRFC
jgi:hypothetical protein